MGSRRAMQSDTTFISVATQSLEWDLGVGLTG